MRTVLQYRTQDVVRLVLLACVPIVVASLVVSHPEILRVFTSSGFREMIFWVESRVQEVGFLAPVLYVLVIVVGVQVFPATPICLGSVALFGKAVASAVNITGCIFGCILSFVIGRYFFRGYARNLVIKGRLLSLDKRAGKNGFYLVLYLRLLWFPFIVLNYAAGVTRIRLRDYALGSAMGLFVPVLLVSYLAGGIGEAVRSFRFASDFLSAGVLVPLACLLASFALPSLIKRYVPGVTSRGEDGDQKDQDATLSISD